MPIRSDVVVALVMASLAALPAPAAAPSSIRDLMLSDGIWEGRCENFVNRGSGVTQRGRIRVEIRIIGHTVRMANTFLDEQGNPSGYTGYASMIVDGDRLKTTEALEVDENTGNLIHDHQFFGHVVANHIYVYESYVEVLPDGKRETRRNTIHYHLADGGRLLQVADVWLDDRLLVFAGTVLERK